MSPKTLTEVAAKSAPVHAKQLEVLRKRWLEELHGDEDLGQLNLADVLGGSGAVPQGTQLDAESMKMIEELMRQLGGE